MYFGEDVLFLKSIEEKYNIFSYRFDVKWTEPFSLHPLINHKVNFGLWYDMTWWLKSGRLHTHDILGKFVNYLVWMISRFFNKMDYNTRNRFRTFWWGQSVNFTIKFCVRLNCSYCSNCKVIAVIFELKNTITDYILIGHPSGVTAIH